MLKQNRVRTYISIKDVFILFDLKLTRVSLLITDKQKKKG